MAILEFGINFDHTPIISEIYYRNFEDVGLNPKLRAGFLTAINNFTSEVFGDDINIISLADFKLICYINEVSLPAREELKKKIVYYCITEKDTNSEIVNTYLKEIDSHFLNKYTFNAIFHKSKIYFRKFNGISREIFGDLILKTEDRFRAIF